MTFLDARSSFDLATAVLTWATLTGVVFALLRLHLRLRRLEARALAADGSPATPATPEADLPTPYAHLMGRAVGERLTTAGEPTPRLLLFLSSACPACARLLTELSESGSGRSAAVAWTDDTPGLERPALPVGTRLLDRGPELSRELGIRVTPFALVLDDHGRTVGAAPVTRTGALRDLTAFRAAA